MRTKSIIQVKNLEWWPAYGKRSILTILLWEQESMSYRVSGMGRGDASYSSENQEIKFIQRFFYTVKRKKKKKRPAHMSLPVVGDAFSDHVVVWQQTPNSTSGEQLTLGK